MEQGDLENSIVVKRVLHRASSITAAKNRLSISTAAGSLGNGATSVLRSPHQTSIQEEKLNKQFDYLRREFMDAALASGVTVPLDMLEDATGRIFGFVQLKGPRYLLHIMDTEIDNGHLLRCSLSLLIVTINILRGKLPNTSGHTASHVTSWVSSVGEGFSAWAAEAIDKIADSYAVTICIKLLKHTHIRAIQELTLNLLSQVVTVSTEAAEFMLQSPYVKDHDVTVGTSHRRGKDDPDGPHGKLKDKLTGISRRQSFDKHPLHLLAQKLAPPSSGGSPPGKSRKSHQTPPMSSPPSPLPKRRSHTSHSTPHSQHHSPGKPTHQPLHDSSASPAPSRNMSLSGSMKMTSAVTDAISAANAVHATTATPTGSAGHASNNHSDVSCLSYLLSICATNKNRFALISSCAEIVIVMTASGDSCICEEVASTSAFPKQNFQSPSNSAPSSSITSSTSAIKKMSSQGSIAGSIGLLRSRSKSSANILRSKSSTSVGTSMVPKKDTSMKVGIPPIINCPVVEWAGVKIFLKFLSRFCQCLGRSEFEPVSVEPFKPSSVASPGLEDDEDTSKMSESQRKQLIDASTRVLLALCFLIVNSPAVLVYVSEVPEAVKLIDQASRHCAEDASELVIVTNCIGMLKLQQHETKKVNNANVHTCIHKLSNANGLATRELIMENRMAMQLGPVGVRSTYTPPPLPSSPIKRNTLNKSTIIKPNVVIARPTSPMSNYNQQMQGFPIGRVDDDASQGYFYDSDYRDNFTRTTTIQQEHEPPFVTQSMSSTQRPNTAPDRDRQSPKRVPYSPSKSPGFASLQRPLTSSNSTNFHQKIIKALPKSPLIPETISPEEINHWIDEKDLRNTREQNSKILDNKEIRKIEKEGYMRNAKNKPLGPRDKQVVNTVQYKGQQRPTNSLYGGNGTAEFGVEVMKVHDDDNGSLDNGSLTDFNFQVKDEDLPNPEYSRNVGLAIEANPGAGYPHMMTEFTPIYDASIHQINQQKP